MPDDELYGGYTDGRCEDCGAFDRLLPWADLIICPSCYEDRKKRRQQQQRCQDWTPDSEDTDG